jgi:hypothetical protein
MRLSGQAINLFEELEKTPRVYEKTHSSPCMWEKSLRKRQKILNAGKILLAATYLLPFLVL